ncbi:MAG: class I SAM-dependent methyltransferase [Chloroflexota bacterium]|nr:class I SAM-dependent methyltransferase [Chloroflexota bacterium]
MTKISEQDYLLKEQYKDDSNLNTRIRLHQLYSTNKGSWHRWVFDHFDFPADARVLELGCGPADLWRQNLDRIPARWQLTLSDMSPGMLEKAKDNLGFGSDGANASPTLGHFQFELIEAQSIPFGDNSFDGVVANHMLYHVPDRRQALREIQRVLKPEGQLYAATNGRSHMQELRQYVLRLVPEEAVTMGAFDQFGLENGTEQLMPWFDTISLSQYRDGLVVTEIEALMAYVQSSRLWGLADENDQDALRQLLVEEMANQGAIHIQKSTGLFIATQD